MLVFILFFRRGSREEKATVSYCNCNCKGNTHSICSVGFVNMLTFTHVAIVNTAVAYFLTVIGAGAQAVGQTLLTAAKFGASPALTWPEDRENNWRLWGGKKYCRGGESQHDLEEGEQMCVICKMIKTNDMVVGRSE